MEREIKIKNIVLPYNEISALLQLNFYHIQYTGAQKKC